MAESFNVAAPTAYATALFRQVGSYLISWSTGGGITEVAPDGTVLFEVVADPDSTWIPNLQWGFGLGDWDARTLYIGDISQSVMWEVPEIGISSKTRPYP